MTLPLAYNFRNLVVRRTTTAMTALGIALSVAVLLAVLSLVSGLRAAFQGTGHPLNVLVLRKGSTSELASNFTRTAYQDLKTRAGIARGAAGEPLASLEIVTVINVARNDAAEGANVTLRGLSPVGLQVREARLAAGRWFSAGRREVVAGQGAADRFPGIGLGRHLRFGRGDWEIVGIFDAGRSAANSEVLADLNQVSADFNRAEVLSSALVRATDAVAARALINDINEDRRLNSAARAEREYYSAQTVSGAPVEFVGMVVAIIMAVGSSVAAAYTMYAAVARRAREIGTLRVLGFSRASILASFFLESLLLSLVGGALGCLLVLPLHGTLTGMGNFVTFSETVFRFRLTPQIVAVGLAFGLIMGAIGGLFPARMAARKQILTALREG